MDLVLKREKQDLFKRSLFVGLALILSYLAITVISFVITTFLYASGYDRNQISLIYNDDYYGYFLNSAILCIAMIFPLLLIKCATKEPVHITAKFKKPNKFWFLAIFFALGMAMIANYATGVFDQLLENIFDFKAVQPEIGDNVYENSFEWAFAIVNVAIIPALIEEFAFRGMILGSLRKYGDTPAIIVSALLFAFYHQNFVQIPFAFIVGIALGILFVVTDSIWTCIIAHFLNNAFALLLNDISQTMLFTAIIIMLSILIIGIFSFVFLKRMGAFKKLNSQKTNLSNTSKLFRMLFNPTIIIFIVGMCYLSLSYRAWNYGLWSLYETSLDSCES